MKDNTKIYYTTKEKRQTVDYYVQRIFTANNIKEAIQAYLDMENCISKSWINEYMEKQIVKNGKLIKVKDHPVLKRVKEEMKRYVIAKFEVIMGISKNSSGEKVFLINNKKELLDVETEIPLSTIKRDILINDLFHQKKKIYEEINRAIREEDITTLEEFYDVLANDFCYRWVIDYYQIKKPIKLARKPEQKTSLT